MPKVDYRKITLRGATFIVGSDGSVDGCKYFAKNRSGYYQTTRMVNSRTVFFLIHRIVAEAFLEKPLFDGCNAVDHIDGDRTNNAAANLRWVTPEENARNAKLKNCTRIIAVSVKTGQSHMFYGFEEARRELHASPNSIYHHDVSGKPLHGEWLINIKRKRTET